MEMHLQNDTIIPLSNYFLIPFLYIKPIALSWMPSISPIHRIITTPKSLFREAKALGSLAVCLQVDLLCLYSYASTSHNKA